MCIRDSAGGGGAGGYDVAGTGGTVTNTNNNITLLKEINGEDADGTSPGSENKGGDGAAGAAGPTEIPCLNQELDFNATPAPTTYSGIGIISTQAQCPNNQTGANYARVGCYQDNFGLPLSSSIRPSESCMDDNADIECQPITSGGTTFYRVLYFNPIFNSYMCQCPNCVTGTKGSPIYHFYGAGGEGAYAEFNLSDSQLNSLGYYDTPLAYSVNSNGSGNSPGNGSIEIYYMFSSVYIKTSSGWQLVKDTYVKHSDVNIGWKTSISKVDSSEW